MPSARSVLNLAPMTLALHDPRTGSKLPYAPTRPTEIACAALVGPLSFLSRARQSVIEDVLARLVGAPRDDQALTAVLVEASGDVCEPEAARYCALSFHYREAPTDSSDDVDPRLRGEQGVTNLAATLQRLRGLPAERVQPVQTAPSSVIAGFPKALRAALEDDLDTPRALLVLEGFLSAVNALCDAALSKKGHVNASAVAAAQDGFDAIAALLGLGIARPEALLRRVRDRRARQRNIDRATVEARVAQRAGLREARDFASADRIQAELLALGVRLHDGPSGTTWTLS